MPPIVTTNPKRGGRPLVQMTDQEYHNRLRAAHMGAILQAARVFVPWLAHENDDVILTATASIEERLWALGPTKAVMEDEVPTLVEHGEDPD